MTDSASLTCNAAACNCADNIQLIQVICKSQRLTNEKLECLKTEVVVDVSAVNSNVTVAGINSYS